MSFRHPSRQRVSDHPEQPGLGAELITGERGLVWLDRSFVWLIQGLALISMLVLVWMGGIMFDKAWPAIKHFRLGFWVSQEWDVGGLVFGALPYIYGTLVSSVLALLLALPVGIAVALITSENFLPLWVRSPLAVVVELIAAIPSVIVGLWGIFVLIPCLQPMQLWLHQHLSQIPLFSTEPAGPGMLAAGVILAVMILPTIAALSREALLALPPDLRTASMALGATRWETILGVLLPRAASGILGAAMLGLGRALGETMAVTMVIGNSSQISASILSPAYTIPAVLANEFAEALDSLHIGALMYLALILFALTLTVNIAAGLMVQAVGWRKSLKR